MERFCGGGVLKEAVSRSGKYSQAVRTGPSQRAVSNLGLKPYQRPVSLQTLPVV